MERSTQSRSPEQWQLEPPEGTPGHRIEEAVAADQARELAAFAESTGRRLQPQLAYARRFVGHLAVGEVAIEPALGPARVAAVEPNGEALTVTWKDDYGPSTASARYEADRVFYARVPGPRDRLTIQRQVDRAMWHRRDIPGTTARLIAAHLHLGPRSLVFRFAINGGILDERLYDELEQVKRNRPAFEPWVHALARYCLSRQDSSPVPGWVPDGPESAVDGDVGECPIPTTSPKSRTLMGRYVTSATVEQLMDAAFDLGVTAARAGVSRTDLGRLARIRAAAMVRRGRSGGMAAQRAVSRTQPA